MKIKELCLMKAKKDFRFQETMVYKGQTFLANKDEKRMLMKEDLAGMFYEK